MNVLLLFDFDGVVADSLEVFQESLAGLCEARGVSGLADRETFLKLFDDNMVAGLRQFGVPEPALPALLDDLGKRLAARMGDFPPFPGLAEALRRLAAAVPVYVVTSNLSGVVEAYLERYGIRGVREVLGAEKEPSKRVKIRNVATRWPGLQPVYVGDTLGDMAEARAAGALPVAVAWGWHDLARLQRGNPVRVLQTPADLADLKTIAG